MILFPNCKINIGLHITAKRSDGFHDIDTLFYPLPFHDALELVTLPGPPSVQFAMTGADTNIPDEKNLCVKAYHLLRQWQSQIPAVKMHLHKCLPTGAGLGGGSSDGAHTLVLLNKHFDLGFTEPELAEIALELGSDCPFFIRNIPAIGRGRGERLVPLGLDLSPYLLVLVHPGIHVNTAWAFSQINPNGTRASVESLACQPPEEWERSLVNDFEIPVCARYPEIAKAKKELYSSGAVYASLTGSGSAVFGLFRDPKPVLPDFPPHYLVKRFSLQAGVTSPGQEAR